MGKFYDRVGASLENLIYKAVAKKRSMSSNLNKSRSIGESLGGTTYNGAGPSSTTVFTQPTFAESACSLATLVTIARHCPALHKLYLPFNTAVLPEIQALDAAEIRRTESGVATSSQDEVPSRSALSVTCAINTVGKVKLTVYSDSVVVVGYTLYD